MRAMVVKEFRELRRDRRTVAMLVGMPLLLLVVFGFAANFTVETLTVTAVGPGAEQAVAAIEANPAAADALDVVSVDPAGTDADARAALRDDRSDVAVVAPAPGTTARPSTSTGSTSSPRSRRRCSSRPRGRRGLGDPLQPRPRHVVGDGARADRPHPHVHRDDHHVDRARQGARGGDVRAARGDAARPRRGDPRQDHALLPARLPRHGRGDAARDVDLRRAVRRTGGPVRGGSRAVPLRRARHRRAHLHRVADHRAGGAGRAHDDAPAGAALGHDLPARRDGGRGALDRVPPAPHVVHRGLAGRDGPRGVVVRAVAAARRARGDGRGRVRDGRPAALARLSPAREHRRRRADALAAVAPTTSGTVR